MLRKFVVSFVVSQDVENLYFVEAESPSDAVSKVRGGDGLPSPEPDKVRTTGWRAWTVTEYPPSDKEDAK